MVEGRFKTSGFTLVELAITLAVVGSIAIIAFFGIGSFNQDQAVANAQKEFLSNLRFVQNKVANGAEGTAVIWVTIQPPPTKFYTIKFYNPVTSAVSTTSMQISNGVQITDTTPINDLFDLCFVNRNLTNYDSSSLTHTCGDTCTDSTRAGFVCVNGANKASVPAGGQVTVTFKKGLTSKTLVIEGGGMYINRIYAK